MTSPPEAKEMSDLKDRIHRTVHIHHQKHHGVSATHLESHGSMLGQLHHSINNLPKMGLTAARASRLGKEVEKRGSEIVEPEKTDDMSPYDRINAELMTELGDNRETTEQRLYSSWREREPLPMMSRDDLSRVGSRVTPLRLGYGRDVDVSDLEDMRKDSIMIRDEETAWARVADPVSKNLSSGSSFGSTKNNVGRPSRTVDLIGESKERSSMTVDLFGESKEAN